MNPSAKLIMKGILLALIKTVTAMLIPYFTFKYISTLEIMGIPIGLTNAQFQVIAFWITALGIIQVAVAFAKGSSPKRSPRKAIWYMVQIIVYSLYLWCYKFSGAASLTLSFEYGAVTYDLAVMLQMWMGVVVLKLIIAFYDLIDGIIHYRKLKARNSDESEVFDDLSTQPSLSGGMNNG